ncbi:GTPase [Magnetospirillum sp. 15-1]|uniref:GTPase family protein n=1 Tax=Magnetospirillum sp. 15-1 TaxID=1979370 RepID=UPI000BBCEE55|nr:GTPase [Magnetospirillum sp. 15-1]
MIDVNNVESFLDALARQGIDIPAEYRTQISSRLNDIIQYEPMVGVFGKTGAGKSSLCNALFGRDICPISDIAACTRTPQQVRLNLVGRGMTLLDVPGVGESEDRDAEYDALYRQWLPKLDLVLWIVKADDRALAVDQDFFKRLVRPYLDVGKPFFVVLSQVDKIEPFREWDEKAHQPGSRQAANIEEKCRVVAGFFGLPPGQVLAASAAEKYGLVELVDGIVHALPAEKRVGVLREVQKEYRSKKAKRDAEKGILDVIVEVAGTALAKAVDWVAGKIGSIFSGWW